MPEKEPTVEAVAPDVREHWRARLTSGETWTEHDALALLRAYGIPTANGEIAEDPDGAAEIAERLGWPVVVKTAAAISHKSDQGGVVVGVEDAATLKTVYDDLSRRLGPRVLVQEMAPKGVELALGTVLDAQFGPLVMVAAGGVWVEIFEDRAFALPTLDRVRAERLLAELAIARLLGGVRGAEPADVGAVVDAMVRLSVLAPRFRRPAGGSGREPADRRLRGLHGGGRAGGASRLTEAVETPLPSPGAKTLEESCTVNSDTIENQIDNLEEGVLAVRAAVEKLSGDAFLGALGNWTPRDIVAHLVGWNRYTAQGAKQLLEGELPFYENDPRRGLQPGQCPPGRRVRVRGSRRDPRRARQGGRRAGRAPALTLRGAVAWRVRCACGGGRDDHSAKTSTGSSRTITTTSSRSMI